MKILDQNKDSTPTRIFSENLGTTHVSICILKWVIKWRLCKEWILKVRLHQINEPAAKSSLTMILGVIALIDHFDLTVNPWLFILPGCQKWLIFNVQQIRTKISHLFPDLSQTPAKEKQRPYQ